MPGLSWLCPVLRSLFFVLCWVCLQAPVSRPWEPHGGTPQSASGTQPCIDGGLGLTGEVGVTVSTWQGQSKGTCSFRLAKVPVGVVVKERKLGSSLEEWGEGLGSVVRDQV